MRPHGKRLDFEDLPATVIADVEASLGAEVIGSQTAVGGFTSGPASGCSLSDGRKVFVKGSSIEGAPGVVQMHRREADVLASLPAEFPAPALVASVASGDWFVVVTEFIDGALPPIPVDGPTVEAVLGFVTDLAKGGSPCPTAAVDRVGTHEAERKHRWAWQKLQDEGHAIQLDPWSHRHLARLIDLERDWIDAAHGESLLHRDLRTDNIVLTTRGATAVDWPAASRGAPWVDLLGLLASFHLEGAPEPHQIFETHPVGSEADQSAVDCYLAALAGYFTRQAMLPPPPRAPQLRSFQAAQGEVCRRWLRSRLGWE